MTSKKYYCKKCKRYHFVSSKIGKTHRQNKSKFKIIKRNESVTQISYWSNNKKIGWLDYGKELNKKIYIYWIEVNKEYRKKGIGSKLMDKLIKIEKVNLSDIDWGYVTNKGQLLRKKYIS